MDIIDYINSLDDVILGKGVSSNEIRKSENELELRFSKEYEKYLENFGTAIINSSEFTGITTLSRLNVVDVTKEKRKVEKNMNNWYVIQETNIDEITIWQDEDGRIYEVKGMNYVKKISDSLLQYIQEYC